MLLKTSLSLSCPTYEGMALMGRIGWPRIARFSSSSLLGEKVDCVVVGAGVVGLAVARKLAMHGRDVLVLESAPSIGTGISSRNSEVIHAGIYHPPASRKARLCVEGRNALYSFCEERGIAHKRIGKLIVATSDSQVPILKRLLTLGLENGVQDLQFMEASEVKCMEPQLRCVKALWSPSTGILDSHAFMVALQADAENSGATFAFNTPVIEASVSEQGICLICGTSDSEIMSLYPKTVVNAAGLSAVALSRRLMAFKKENVPEAYFARGCYFRLASTKKAPFSHLIYPVPEEGGLGVHATLDLSGQVKFGPDVEWLHDINEETAFRNRFDYTMDPERSKRFYLEIQKYYPFIQDGTLEPDYAGIRPKLSGPAQQAADFHIQDERQHGIRGLINLLGIESPGLTASLAIANLVYCMLST